MKGTRKVPGEAFREKLRPKLTPIEYEHVLRMFMPPMDAASRYVRDEAQE